MQALAMPASRYIFGTLPWYSVTMVCAILSALLLAQGEEKRRGLPKDTVVDLALRLIPCGIIGARLYYVAFTWSLFRENPIAILEIWKGGLAIYGGLIGGFLAALVFARRRKLNLLTLIDMIVPGLALAQCIGRWGNYFNMEAYGLPITNPAFQFFPMAVLIPEGGTQVWHMATFFYESLWDFGVFIALRCLRKPYRRPGDLFGWYVLLYGAGRLIIEGLRMDSLMTSGGSARISQLLSVAGCLIVYLLMTCHALRHKRKTVVSFGLLCALAIAVVVYLLPAPAEAFYGYRLAFAVQVGCICGSVLAMGLNRLGWQLARFVPALLALVFQLAVYLRLAGQPGSTAVSVVLCSLFGLTLIAACGGMFPFAKLAAAPSEDAAV